MEMDFSFLFGQLLKCGFLGYKIYNIGNKEQYDFGISCGF